MRTKARMAHTKAKSNPVVRRLIKTRGGRMYRFDALPREAQLAMIQYMAFDGEAWTPFDSTPAKALSKSIEVYGRERFGLVSVPTKALIKAVMECAKHNHDMPWKSFEEYHRWYLGEINPGRPLKRPWPVILSDFADEALQDGWHRFHDYVRRGMKTILCLYYPRQHSAIRHRFIAHGDVSAPRLERLLEAEGRTA